MPEVTRFTGWRLVIFDADDTLRRTTVPGKPCPHAPGEWELLPGVRAALAAIPWGRPGAPHLGVATNQDQVGYGLFSEEIARELLRELLRAAAGHVPPDQALQLCPHVPEDRCDCRKPEPGMLRRIMRHYGVAPADTLFVGNAQTDAEAARRAGSAFAWAAEVLGRGSEGGG